MYTSFAISQQGESHIKANNKPCEDATGLYFEYHHYEAVDEGKGGFVEQQ